MKTNAKEILRWIALAAFGGFGVWLTIYGCYCVFTHPQGGWIATGLAFDILALFCAPFYVVAYICFRRRYRKLFNVLAVAGAIVVYCILSSLPRHLRIQEFYVVDPRSLDGPWSAFRALLGLAVSLLCILVPYCGALWIYRRCRRIAEPR
jgi:hypothetical protein